MKTHERTKNIQITISYGKDVKTTKINMLKEGQKIYFMRNRYIRVTLNIENKNEFAKLAKAIIIMFLQINDKNDYD